MSANARLVSRRKLQRVISYSGNEGAASVPHRWSRLTLAPLGGAQRAPPCGFSQIAPEVLGISL